MRIIIKGVPPNYAEILKVFPSARRPGVIFAYAPNIYVTGSPNIPIQLLNHEEVHLRRQEAMGVEAWWQEYLADPQFRYNEELLAHREEYRTLMGNGPSRQVRRQTLKILGSRLASALYGSVVTVQQAMEAISEGSGAND